MSYPMSNVHSKGVGGSSVISVTGGAITVGSALGRCRAGAGLFRLRWQAGHHHRRQPASRRPRRRHLPRRHLHARCRPLPGVITETVADPLGISLEEALVRMEQAYFEAVSASFAHLATPDTTLAAFGGAGPMSATGAARPAGVKPGAHPADSGGLLRARDLLLRHRQDLRGRRPGADHGVGPRDLPATCWSGPNGTCSRKAIALASVLTAATWSRGGRPTGTGRRSAALPPGTTGDPGRQVSRCGSPSPPRCRIRTLAADTAVDPSPGPGRRAPGSIRSVGDRVDDVPVHVLDDLEPGPHRRGPGHRRRSLLHRPCPAGWTFRVTSAGRPAAHSTSSHRSPTAAHHYERRLPCESP